jgi:hypothetical protein
MPTIAQTPDVLSRVRTTLDQQARAAAGGNDLISRDEQATLPSNLLKRQADAIRTAGGAGTRVSIDELVAASSGEVERLLGQVNQPSGQGAHSVSRTEVQALAALDVDVAQLVAAAYEFITGRSAELDTDGAAPVDPVTPPGPPVLVGKLTPTAVSIAPPMSSHTPKPDPTIRADGAIEMPSAGNQPSTMTIEVGGRRIVASVPTNETMSGRVTNVATAPDLVEAIRRAAPDLYVNVIEHSGGTTAIELWDTPPPSPASPIYLFAQMRDASGTKVGGLELRGPKTFVSGDIDIPAGTTMTLRLDDKVYSATSSANEKSGSLMRKIRDQVEADGHTVSLKEYTRIAPWTFRVID